MNTKANIYKLGLIVITKAKGRDKRVCLVYTLNTKKRGRNSKQEKEKPKREGKHKHRANKEKGEHKSMIISFAYIRCSDESQHLDRQYEAIRKFRDVSEGNIFAEKITGKTDQREQYQAMKIILLNLSNINSKRPEGHKDTIEVIIEDLDRLGRTKKIIRDEMQWFSDHGIKLRILEIPTTLIEIDEENDWVLDMVNRILIEVYTALAEQELKKKERRTREGIEAAKLRGVYKGRKPIETPANFEVVYKRWRNNEITARKAMELTNLKTNTFYKIAKQFDLRAEQA